MKRQPGLGRGAAMLCLAVVIVGCDGKKDEVQAIASARAYIASEQHSAAIIELKSLLQGEPKSGEGRFLLAEALLATGDAAGAEAEFLRALENGFPAERVAVPLATALLALGKPQDLIDRYRGVNLAAVEADAELKTQLALAYAENGDTGEAEKVIALALQWAPGFLPARLLDARLQAARGDLGKSLAITDQILAQAPDNAQAWLLKGDLLLQRDPDSAESLAAYHKALALRADLLPAHRALVTIRIRQRDIEAARRQWDEMSKALPGHPQTLYYEALIAYLDGRLGRAREINQLLVRGSPNNARVLLLAGQTETRLGSLAQAESLLLRAMEAAPKAPEPRRALAATYLQGGEAKKALAILDFLESLINSPRSEDGESLALAAQAYLLLGEFGKADENFARAARLLPEDQELRVARARAQLGRGQDEAPLAELSDIATIYGGTSADLALISARLRRKEWDVALTAVDALAKKLPSSPLPEQLRGEIAWARHDAAAALQSFEQALAKDPRYFPAVQGMALIELAENKPAAARARFEKLLADDPQNVSAMIALADWMGRTGMPTEQIIQLLNKAVKTRPNDPLTHQALIDHYRRTGDQATALAVAAAAVKALPAETTLLESLGAAQLAAGDINQAILTFSNLVHALPRSVAARLRLADALLSAGQSRDADYQVQLAMQLAPTARATQRAAVAMAMRQNEAGKALLQARALQKQFPQEALGFRLEGDIEASRQNWAAAVSAFGKALALDDPGDTAVRLHWALGTSGKPGEATRFEQAWRQAHPRDADFLVHLGEMAMLRNDWPAAEAYYRQVLELRPDTTLALNNLAYLLVQLKKPGALPLAQRAVALAPRRPDMLDTLALAYAEVKQFDQAIETQRLAINLAPESPSLRLGLARLYLQAGDRKKARLELKTLAALGESFGGQEEVAALLRQVGP